ncbi:calcium-binding protein [Tropicibacter oceani]|uniref:Calcium-binding protein n=1 Tax=Tropicibacter oceani TaxID=3058420 RepID=A0ABY8QM10_9RHOB|nr:calcium-binding protein [Tropicibacter oceani]WGW05685.1 calcium-binding protein [Tropicibacter oceani]
MTIAGNKWDNLLTGTAGDDSIIGRGGNDTLLGQDGADTLKGGNQDDSLGGGLGDDVLSGNRHNDTLYGNEGNDKLYGGADDDLLYGGSGNDTLNGGKGSDVLFGGTGDDILRAAASDGSDTIDGGEGNDRAYLAGDQADYSVQWLGGTEVLLTHSGGNTTLLRDVETITFGDGTVDFHTLSGAPKYNLVATGITAGPTVDQGNYLSITHDYIAAFDPVPGGTPVQMTLYISTTPDMTGVVETRLVTSGSFGDRSTFSIPSSVEIGWDYAPGTYYVMGAIDTNDSFDETDETDNATEWTSFEVIETAQPVADAAATGITYETPWGGGDWDLTTNNGNFDVTVDLANESTLSGVRGFGYSVVLSADAVFDASDIVLGTGTISLDPAETGSATVNVELSDIAAPGDYHIGVVVGDRFFDYGSYAYVDDADLSDNVLFTPISFVGGITTGTEGNDLLQGTSGDDTILGLGGDDTLAVTLGGDDYADGGAGTDVLDLSGIAPRTDGTGVRVFDTYSGNTIEVIQYSPTDFIVVAENFEAVIGTEGNDEFTFVGGPSGLSVYGGGGDDVMLGGDDPHHYFGGDGNDVIMGSEAGFVYGTPNDTIDGGAGDDSIYGGAEDDLLTGGTGADVFSYYVYPGDGFYDDGNDTITDFDVIEDVVQVTYDPGTTAPELADIVTQTPEGALITLADGESVLLQGVDAALLTTTNVDLIQDEYDMF